MFVSNSKKTILAGAFCCLLPIQVAAQCIDTSVETELEKQIYSFPEILPIRDPSLGKLDGLKKRLSDLRDFKELTAEPLQKQILEYCALQSNCLVDKLSSNEQTPSEKRNSVFSNVSYFCRAAPSQVRFIESRTKGEISRAERAIIYCQRKDECRDG